MFCFKDMTFCSATCGNSKCHRKWRLRDKGDYRSWSKLFGEGSGPVAFSDFSDNCDEFMPEDK